MTYKYTIKNTGTAVAKGLTITDKLPEGLKTNDGKGTVTFDVGELSQDDSQDFQVKLVASKTGKFASRATATGGDDLKVQSKKPTTQIRQAKLNVAIDGPDAEYINQPITYTVTVKNDGDAPAEESRLEVQLADNAKLVQSENSEESQGGGDLSWNLGTLKPGDSQKVRFTAVGKAKGKMEHTVVATSACARASDNKELRTAANGRATTQTEILTLPALLIAVVDEHDPVKVGENETYTITVVNQGTGADTNVQVLAKLPQGFEYVEADGPTKAQADGQNIQFGAIDQLDPGDRVSWKLRAEAQKDSDVQLRVELTSDYLTQPAISTEPTRMIK